MICQAKTKQQDQIPDHIAKNWLMIFTFPRVIMLDILNKIDKNSKIFINWTIFRIFYTNFKRENFIVRTIGLLSV